VAARQAQAADAELAAAERALAQVVKARTPATGNFLELERDTPGLDKAFTSGGAGLASGEFYGWDKQNPINTKEAMKEFREALKEFATSVAIDLGLQVALPGVGKVFSSLLKKGWKLTKAGGKYVFKKGAKSVPIKDLADRSVKMVSKPPKTPSDAINRWTRRQGGYIDPATNRWVEKAIGDYTQVQSGHIYPADLIKKLSGFDKLSRAQQDWLLNHPDNFIPLPRQWNSSMGSRLADDWAKTPRGKLASKEFIDQLRTGQEAFVRMAKDQIARWLSP
jgi:hypothetical protein